MDLNSIFKKQSVTPMMKKKTHQRHGVYFVLVICSSSWVWWYVFAVDRNDQAYPQPDNVQIERDLGSLWKRRRKVVRGRGGQQLWGNSVTTGLMHTWILKGCDSMCKTWVNSTRQNPSTGKGRGHYLQWLCAGRETISFLQWSNISSHSWSGAADQHKMDSLSFICFFFNMV